MHPAQLHPDSASPSMPWLATLLPALRAEVSNAWTCDQERHFHLSRLLPTLKSLTHTAQRLGLQADGTAEKLQARLLAAGDALLPFLHVGELARSNRPSAIEEVARRILTGAQLTACRGPHGILDRLQLHLVLFETEPEALLQVWALDQWQRQSLRQFVLVGPHRPLLRLSTVRARCAPPAVPPPNK